MMTSTKSVTQKINFNSKKGSQFKQDKSFDRMSIINEDCGLLSDASYHLFEEEKKQK